MNTIYVLILVLSSFVEGGRQTSTITAEFNSEETCKVAAKSINDQSTGYDGWGREYRSVVASGCYRK